MYIVQVAMSAMVIEPFDCESHIESTKSLSMAIELQWHSHIQENRKGKWHGNSVANGGIVHFGNQIHMHLTVNDMNREVELVIAHPTYPISQ